MPIRARERITGLVLALCLNAAFIAMFVWQASPRLPDLTEPSRMALVWARPVADATPPPANSPAAQPRTRAARGTPAPIATITPPAMATPAPAPPSELIVESDSADPFEKNDSAVAASFDKAVTGRAIKAAIAERQALEDTQKFVKSGRGPTRFERFAANVEDVTTPYCLGSDPMKHAPPVVDVAGVKVGIGGIYALPFWVKAVASGKCRMK